MPLTPRSSLEVLEARIAPASVTYTSAIDPNDKVTITVSKGSLADLTAAISNTSPLAGPAMFVGEDFSFTLTLAGKSVFKGANVTVATTGDATALLTKLDATGYDLGTVSIPTGELGLILAGDNKLSTPAVKKVVAAEFGTTAHGVSVLHGSLTTLQVTQDMGGSLTLETKSGSLASATIGGKLAGNATQNSGSIIANGKIGKIVVTGGLVGGAGEGSGSIFAATSITEATVGSIVGGLGVDSANLITNGTLAKVTVNGDVRGNAVSGSGAGNGRINAGGFLKMATVTGQLQGGAANNSGNLISFARIGTVVVQGGMQGGAGLQSGSIGTDGAAELVVVGVAGGPTDQTVVQGGSGSQSGSILATGKLTSVLVYGSVQGGSGPDSGVIATKGTLARAEVSGALSGGTGPGSGSIGAEKSVGTVTVQGDVTGVGDRSGQIASGGPLSSVFIGGDLNGGAGEESGAVGALGAIGSITVNGNLFGSTGYHSASILGGTSLVSLTIGQSLVGYTAGSSDGSDARVEVAGSIKTVLVKGSLTGGANPFSAVIRGGSLGSVTVEGSLTGGVGVGSAAISSGGALDTLLIKVNVQGGSGDDSAAISVNGRLNKATVNGSIIAGSGATSASVIAGSIGALTVLTDVEGGGFYGGAILSLTGDIDSIQIGGTLHSTGRMGTDPQNLGVAFVSAFRNLGTLQAGAIVGSISGEVSISAGGNLSATTQQQGIAIRAITTMAQMQYTKIRAGYAVVQEEGLNLQARNYGASVGLVEVGTSEEIDAPWIGNDVLAGVRGFFGAEPITFGNLKVDPKILSIIIHGALGASQNTHGISAPEVVSVKAGTNFSVDLTKGPENDVIFNPFPAELNPSQNTYIFETSGSA